MKLKPCPFCGSENPEIVNASHCEYYVSCVNCGGQTWGLIKADAIREWNTRASGWVSVEDRLSERGLDVLVMTISGDCDIAWYDPPTKPDKWGWYFAGGWRGNRLVAERGDCIKEDVILWMPQPEPPEVKDDE